jgi:hypothetical protein
MERLLLTLASAAAGYYVGKALETKSDAVNIAIAACLASLSSKIKL